MKRSNWVAPGLRPELRMWGCDIHKLYLLGRARRLIWRAKARGPHR